METEDKNQTQQNNAVLPESIEVDTSTLKSVIDPSVKGHRWIQRGEYIVCKSCPIQHSIYVGVDQIMIGYDDNGYPKFKKV